MTIPAIPAVGSPLAALSNLATGAASPVTPSTTGSAAISTTTPGADFASVLGKGLDAVSQAQNKADTLAVQAATGDLTDISDYTIAATQASLLTELATTIRTKGVDAFNQIMGMQG
ncbi:MAG: flagellar hook-basal body complex protein FliE [Pseudonocardiales bacterium]|jgi:flagellar hook-basal body complex protein FliE|nr:flagellar hook-basal body complex protein FliE [Pseudonocardiales bacterium]